MDIPQTGAGRLKGWGKGWTGMYNMIDYLICLTVESYYGSVRTWAKEKKKFGCV